MGNQLQSTLPFCYIPGRIIIDSISFSVMWLNALPSKNGISTIYSQQTIMTNTALDYSKHCKTPFGSYCQVHTHRNPINTDQEWTVDAICMGPTGNMQGGYKFFALET